MSLARLAALYGIDTFYEPSPGVRRAVSPEAVAAVLAALGVDAEGEEAVARAVAAAQRRRRARALPETVVAGSPALDALPHGALMRLAPEDGGAEIEWTWAGELPELPYGVHRLSVLTPGGPLPPEPAAPAAPGEAPTPEPPFPAGNPEPPFSAGSPEPLFPAGNPEPPFPAESPDPPFPAETHARSSTSHLIVAPDRAPAPPARAHGLLVQLYSLLSRRSWGMGDLGDLRELAAWAGRSLGAGFLQVNPLHAAVPGTPERPADPSPYRPSSRRFPDPVHLRIEEIEEYAYLPPHERERAAALAEQAAKLRESVLDKGALIDRDAVWRLKSQALELIARVPLGPGRRAAYCDFLAAGGADLERHATYYALAERHGPDWRRWPKELRDPASAATARAAGELMDRVDFHSRLVWLADTQLGAAQAAAREAGMSLGLILDLAVGVHPDGADTWAQGDLYAAGISVGAPPDAFNAHGQDWGLPPWRPDRLAACGYAPFRALLRGLLAHAGALRIDHIMGLFRLWWIPEGHPPTDGAYVRYDAEALLALLALEAHRAGAAVIGEDLGTVERGVREALAARGVLGTSVLWFERDWEGDGLPLPPERWRADCLATVTTHDLPPTAAKLGGEHIRLRHRLGLLAGPLEAAEAAEGREVREWLALLDALGLPGGTEEQEIQALYRFLRRTPARLVGVWLPDAVGDRRPQNVPGTWDAHPNWRLPVADGTGRPVTLEDLAASQRLHELIAALRAPVWHPGRAPGEPIR